MPDRADPAVPFVLGGKTRYLKGALGAVHEFQQLSGLDIYRDGLDVEALTADQFRLLAWCCLVSRDKARLTLKQVSRMISKKTLLEVLPFVKIALGLSWPEAEKSAPAAVETKEKPGTDWPGLWSFGRRSLGLSEAEFWDLTLAQFIALRKRWEAEQESLDYRTGVIASTILNTIPRTEETKNKVYTPADIFPHYGWGEDAGEPDEEDIRAHFKSWALMAGAEISEN